MLTSVLSYWGCGQVVHSNRMQCRICALLLYNNIHVLFVVNVINTNVIMSWICINLVTLTFDSDENNGQCIENKRYISRLGNYR